MVNPCQENITLIIIMLLCAAAAYLWIGIDLWASTPIVYESYATGDCVRVYDARSRGYSCENMPDRYEHRWVE